MATVHLDDRLYERLQASAEARGSSADAEAGRIIAQYMPVERIAGEQAEIDGIIARMRALHKEQRAHHGGPLPDSLPLLRQMRDEE